MEDLIAWQKARVLIKKVHEVSGKGFFYRDRNLKNQICRTSVSVMSNVAEGFEREGEKEFVQFLSQAKASCGEVRSPLFVALDRGYVNDVEFNALLNLSLETSRVIAGLIG
ncbi:MAG: four helix bundle protein [bacterium]|nr:four helix bundle protein [bacterium]MDT8366970.1 four helix bundle protein [bacterium]